MLREVEAMKRLFEVARGNIEGKEREEVYRNLVFGRFLDFIETSFPLSCEAIGKEVEELVEKFLKREHSSPLLMDLGREFIDFVSEEGKKVQEKVPFILELLEYEWAEIELFNAPEDQPAQRFEWNSNYRLSSSSRLIKNTYPVHKVPFLSAEEVIKNRGSHYLLMYRGEKEQVRSVQLTEFVFKFLEGIESGKTPADSLKSLELPMSLEDVEPYLEKFCTELVSLGVLVKR